MKLKLLVPHIVANEYRPAGTILDPPPPGYSATPFMQGLDEEGVAAVARAALVVFGRFPWPYGLYPPHGRPLDSPPIPRPIDDNQPVFHFVGTKEYIS